jgi:hypothetical protein
MIETIRGLDAPEGNGPGSSHFQQQLVVLSKMDRHDDSPKIVKQPQQVGFLPIDPGTIPDDFTRDSPRGEGMLPQPLTLVRPKRPPRRKQFQEQATETKGFDLPETDHHRGPREARYPSAVAKAGRIGNAQNPGRKRRVLPYDPFKIRKGIPLTVNDLDQPLQRQRDGRKIPDAGNQTTDFIFIERRQSHSALLPRRRRHPLKPRITTSNTLTEEMLVKGKSLTETNLYQSLSQRYAYNLKERVMDPLLKNDNFRNAIKDYATESFKSYDKRIRSDVSLLIKNLKNKFKYTEPGTREVCIYVIDNDIAARFSR